MEMKVRGQDISLRCIPLGGEAYAVTTSEPCRHQRSGVSSRPGILKVAAVSLKDSFELEH